MRRKRYKQGHINLLALEASTLNYKSIDTRLNFHTNRQRYAKVGPSGLQSDHRVASYARIGDEGKLTASYVLTLKPSELVSRDINLGQLVKNSRASANACIESWNNTVTLDKVSCTKTPDNNIMVWIIISTQLKNYVSHQHGTLHHITTNLKEHEAAQLLDVYASVHYVLFTCILEYPGFFITGKTE